MARICLELTGSCSFVGVFFAHCDFVLERTKRLRTNQGIL